MPGLRTSTAARRLAAAIVLAAAAVIPVAEGAPAAPPERRGVSSLPPGTSALDAWAAWRAAEGKTYRLSEDGVRTFSCRVDSSLVDLLAAPGGPFDGDPPRITLWWRDGESRATVEGGAKLDAESRGRLASLVEPLAEMILPLRPSRGLVAHSFRFIDGAKDEWLRIGERGLEATARNPGEDPVRAVLAIGPDGLVVRERIERLDGGTSEFEYEHVLQDGRWLMKSARGTFRGMKVSVQLEWGLLAAHRPLPTRLQVEQKDEEGPLPDGIAVQVFRFTRHQVNAEIPEGILPSELPGAAQQPPPPSQPPQQQPPPRAPPR